MMAASSSVDGDATRSPASRATAVKTFTSPAFRVYIEDTDAYGVMYNSNYLRSYERALSHVVVPVVGGDDGGNGHHGWVLSSVAEQRFRSSPSLGGEYVVRGELVERERDGNSGDGDGDDVEIWRLEMVAVNENEVQHGHFDDDEERLVVHNSAVATVTRRRRPPPETAPSSAPVRLDAAERSGRFFECAHTAYRDEFDYHAPASSHPHHRSSSRPLLHLPLRSALNYFERSRSTYLGGPDALRRMQEEEDLLWVVTGIDECELLLDSVAIEEHSHSIIDRDNGIDVDDGDDDDDGEEAADTVMLKDAEFDDDWHPVPGREVIVRTDFVVKRRGMIVDCRHRLYLDVGGDPRIGGNTPMTGGAAGTKRRRRLLAQATVTIMALRGSTRRPTSKLPGWILDKFA